MYKSLAIHLKTLMGDFLGKYKWPILISEDIVNLNRSVTMEEKQKVVKELPRMKAWGPYVLTVLFPCVFSHIYSSICPLFLFLLYYFKMFLNIWKISINGKKMDYPINSGGRLGSHGGIHKNWNCISHCVSG